MHTPNEKLPHYLALVGSATGRVAADLALRAAADPALHVFAELLAAPGIAALAADPSTAPAHALLALLAYGTYADYAAAPSSYPPLEPAVLAKLRALSLLSLAAGRTTLPYAPTAAALDLPSARALEQLVLSARAAGLLRARLDPRAARVLIDWTAPRDAHAAPRGVADLAAALTAWRGSSERLLAALDTQAAFVADETARKRAAAAAREAAEAATRATVTGAGGGAGKRALPMPPLLFGERAVATAAGDMLEPIDADVGVQMRRGERRLGGGVAYGGGFYSGGHGGERGGAGGGAHGWNRR